MKIADVLPGENFQWAGDHYRLRYHNRNCVQAEKSFPSGYSTVYTLIDNGEQVKLTRSALGREHLVTA